MTDTSVRVTVRSRIEQYEPRAFGFVFDGSIASCVRAIAAFKAIQYAARQVHDAAARTTLMRDEACACSERSREASAEAGVRLAELKKLIEGKGKAMEPIGGQVPLAGGAA